MPKDKETFFKGGASVNFEITDGTSNIVDINTETGVSTFSGNLDAVFTYR